MGTSHLREHSTSGDHMENKIMSSFVILPTQDVLPIFGDLSFLERKACFAGFKSLHQEFDHVVLGIDSLLQVGQFSLKYSIVMS